MFAIDVTRSINEQQRLDDMLYFIKNVVQGFNISNLKTHVAVLTFNEKVTVFTELTAEKETFNKAMRNLTYLQPKGFAFTHLALHKAGSIFTNGSRNSTSAKALVLLTDSSCNSNKKCPEPVEKVAQRLNGAGIHTFSIALSEISVKEMAAVGSLPGNRYIRINHFPRIRDGRFISDMRNIICEGIFYVLSCIYLHFVFDLINCKRKTVMFSLAKGFF